jgi:hypothetical protein
VRPIFYVVYKAFYSEPSFIFKGQIVSMDILTLEDETTTLPQNGNQLPIDAVSYPRREEA